MAKEWWIVDGYVDINTAEHDPYLTNIGKRDLEIKFMKVYLEHIEMYIDGGRADLNVFKDIYLNQRRLINGDIYTFNFYIGTTKESFLNGLKNSFVVYSIGRMAICLDNDMYPFDELPTHINDRVIMIRSTVLWRLHNGR